MSFDIINPLAATDDVCSICLDSLNKEQTYELPECGHKYHTNCIFHWLRCGHNKCPYCGNMGSTNSESDNDYSYHSYSKDQYIILRRFSRNKNAPSELKNLVEQLKKLEQKQKSLSKELNEIKRKKGIFKDLQKLYHKKQHNFWHTQSRIRRLKKNICNNTNITPLILVKKQVI